MVAIGRTWGKKNAGSLSDSESRTPRQASREGTVAGILYRWPKAIPSAFVRGNVDWPGISSAVVNVATAAIFTSTEQEIISPVSVWTPINGLLFYFRYIINTIYYRN